MADWQGIQAGLESGYLLGRQIGGKMSALGGVISKVADRLRQERQAQEELSQKRNILGMEEASKIRLAQEGDRLVGERLKNLPAVPPDMEVGGYSAEGRPYYRRASTGEQAIVDAEGNIIGMRPKGSVFQPKEDQTQAIINAIMGGEAPQSSPKITQPLSKSEGKRVKVVDSKGNKFTLPENQLAEALKQGYKRIP